MQEKEWETYGNMDGGEKRWGKAWNNIQGGPEQEYFWWMRIHKLTHIVGSTLDDYACGYANMKWYKMIKSYYKWQQKYVN